MKRVLGLLMLLTIVAGCRNEGPPPSGRSDRVAPQDYPHIVAVERLHRELRFGPAVVDEASSGRPMRVTQPLRNISNRLLHVQYRFQFMDEAGRPLKTNQGWRYADLAPQGVETSWDSNSMEDTAVDWRLEIRPAQ